MKLNEKIIKIRKENGLSQEEFGDKINVSRQAVSKWENEEAKPDIEKIQQIAKKFSVSYEYLLNDEIETIEKVDKSSNKKEPKSKTKSFFKVILIIFIIYLLICIYKFIVFYRFYTIANSFSEKNYAIIQNSSIYTKPTQGEDITFYTTKVGNKILEQSYSKSNIIKDENGKSIPYSITYTDIEKREAYGLYYDKDKQKYMYNDRKNDMINDEEIEELFVDKNDIKENTLDSIPSSFKEILWSSINPMFYYVDILNREIRFYSITDQAYRAVKLSKDYLLERVYIQTKDGKSMDVVYSYDYIQDHFKEIVNSIETYKDKIIFEN